MLVCKMSLCNTAGLMLIPACAMYRSDCTRSCFKAPRCAHAISLCCTTFAYLFVRDPPTSEGGFLGTEATAQPGVRRSACQWHLESRLSESGRISNHGHEHAVLRCINVAGCRSDAVGYIREAVGVNNARLYQEPPSAGEDSQQVRKS